MQQEIAFRAKETNKSGARRYNNSSPCVMTKWRKGQFPPFNFLGTDRDYALMGFDRSTVFILIAIHVPYKH